MEALKKKTIKIINVKLAKKFILLLTVIFAFEALAFPLPGLASAPEEEATETEIKIETNLSEELNQSDLEVTKTTDKTELKGQLPVNKKIITKKAGYHPMTAYNSETAQTDSSPCITANGFNVCKHGVEDTVAANFLPFGTKIKIPDLFGDRVFVVRDRMNARYTNRIDVWMLNRSDAMKFGVRNAKIEILEP